MAIIMSNGLMSQEIRVLQEYRRVKSETLTAAAIKAIKHPAGGGDAPALSLVEKGYLRADPGGESFSLTPTGIELLSHDPVPMNEGVAGDDEDAHVDA